MDGPQEKNEKTSRRVFGEDELWSILGNCSRTYSRLQQCLSVLPAVDVDGHSECPFAETLYARKEEAENEAAGSLVILRSCVPHAKEEVRIAEKNLDEIRAGMANLYEDAPQKELANAAESAERVLQGRRSRHDQLVSMIGDFERLLDRSRGKRFPGRESPLPSRLSTAGVSRGSTPIRSSLSPELGGLFSLGPLEMRGQSRPVDGDLR